MIPFLNITLSFQPSNFSLKEQIANQLVSEVTPALCYKLQALGVISVLMFIACIVFNTFLLWVFFKNKELQSSFNMFIVALSILNLIGSILEFPYIIVSNFYCRWWFDEVGCIFSGYIMYFTGVTSIYILVSISLERCYIINSHTKNRFIGKSTVVNIVGCCGFIGLFWATLPLFGWSYYSLEGANTSCSVEWNERSWNVFSYNFCMFIFVYFIPLIIIVVSNTKLIFMVLRLQRLLRKSEKFKFFEKKTLFEIKATLVMIIIITGYFISWTPYAMATLYTAFIRDPEVEMDPLLSTIPALFAKSSMLWTSALYVFSNRQLKRKFNVDLISFIVTKNHSSSEMTEKRIYKKRTPLRAGPRKPDIFVINNY